MAIVTDQRRLALRGVTCECGSHAWAIMTPCWLVTMVSPQDAHLLRKHGMGAVKSARTFYATFKVQRNGKRTTYFLHCVIKKRKKVDHRNRNGLDNRRRNLRPASASQNQANRAKITNSRWPYKGIRMRNGVWTAHIGVKQRTIHLGTYETDVLAALAYDAAAKKHYGKFANLNFPEE